MIFILWNIIYHWWTIATGINMNEQEKKKTYAIEDMVQYDFTGEVQNGQNEIIYYLEIHTYVW